MGRGGTAQGFHLSTLWAANGSRHISGGCYRLSQPDATWLFGWAPIGTPVHVYRSVCDSPYASFCRLDRAPSVAPPHPPQFPIGQGQIHPPMLLPWKPAPHPPQVLLPTPKTVTPPAPAPPHAGRRNGHAPRTAVARIAAFFGALRRALS